MKKRNIIISAICLFMIFILTGCGNKTAITTNEFKSKTESLGYTTVDATSQFTSSRHVLEATIAQSSNGYQVEFYVLDDVGNATSMFNTNKATFETYKGNTTAESSASIGNYSSYTLSSSGYYMHICRIDNTLLYVKVKDIYKEPAKTLIKELGY